jgi:release factor glutamine methyltransferase
MRRPCRDPALPVRPVTTIHHRVAEARDRLLAAGIQAPEADLSARLLAEHLLGWDTARLYTSGGELEPTGFAGEFDALVARRAAREPLHYIVGHREFWAVDFEVSPAVLIPRADTELIVEVALELFPSPAEHLVVAEAGTGCGCLAVAIALERPNARITATEISEAALDVARRNARRHGVADRITFVQGDLLAPVSDGGGFDFIMANPPYVAELSRPGLQPEVRDHEPDVALFGGADGLHLIKRLVEQVPARLHQGGYLAFEFGCGQDEDIERLVRATAGLELVELKRDLQGIARTAVARRT